MNYERMSFFYIQNVEKNKQNNLLTDIDLMKSITSRGQLENSFHESVDHIPFLYQHIAVREDWWSGSHH